MLFLNIPPSNPGPYAWPPEMGRQAPTPDVNYKEILAGQAVKTGMRKTQLDGILPQNCIWALIDLTPPTNIITLFGVLSKLERTSLLDGYIV